MLPVYFDDEEASALNSIIEFAANRMEQLKLDLKEAGYTPEVVARACSKLAEAAGEDAMLEVDDLR